MRIRMVRLVAALLLGVGLSACSGDGPLPAERTSTVTMRFLTPATMRSLVVEVSGPGITPAVVINVPVGDDSVATGSLTLPAGSARRFVVTAVDTAGVLTHRADTTITLQSGVSQSLQMRLDPLASSVGITVTFGGVRLVVQDTSARVLGVGDSTVIHAFAIRANGDTVPGDSLVWGSGNPAVAVVEDGLVRFVRQGTTSLSVGFLQATARVSVSATEATAAPALTGTLLLKQGSDVASATYSLVQVGGAANAAVVTSSAVIFSGGFFGSLAPDQSFVLQGDMPFSDNMWRRNAPDWSPVTIFGTGARDYVPRISADGLQVVWCRETTLNPSQREIWIGNVDGTGGVQLTSNGEADNEPDLSPDAERIVWSAVRSGAANIWTMTATGDSAQQLTSSGVDHLPRYSPDGGSIAFLSSRSGSLALYVMAADGSAVREVPGTRGLVVSGSPTNGEVAPLWSPDGRVLMFAGQPASGVLGVYFVPADGSLMPSRLRDNAAEELAYDWRS